MDSYAICGQLSPRSDCAFAQSDQGLHCPLTESFGSRAKKSGPFVVRLEEPVYGVAGTSMNAQADLGCEAFRLFVYYKKSFARDASKIIILYSLILVASKSLYYVI